MSISRIPTRDTDPCDQNSDNDLIPGNESTYFFNFREMGRKCEPEILIRISNF